ncbi:CGNR zinc finger domain-containing protein [Rhodococcoides yunnanense]|uniref:CGNR zinc finger domain-containing protein n=1 Tax=Rhodococcoides yunnanense TaxID=278209 RepID=UPI000932CE8A|nr:CGNR zinc finger domain-containing protein [Rhodococcus yunnanensis]
MHLAPDSREALVAAAALVNTGRGGIELLGDVSALGEFFLVHGWTGRRDGSDAELDAVRSLRQALGQVWDASDVDDAARLVNAMLLATHARPQLARHGDVGWHLHMSSDADALADRMGAEAAMAILDLIRSGDIDRLRRCVSAECDAVLVDLTKNKSKLYCDTGNCGNREHVAAYRARKSSNSGTTRYAGRRDQ